MKKYLKLILLIILMVTLSSCGDASHRKLFNQLYNKNFDTAEKYANEELSKGKYSYYVFDLSEISEGHEFDFVLNDKAIYRNEGIDRIILSSLEVDGEVYYGIISVIEFETVEAAEAMLAKVDIDNIDLVRYENLVYYMDTFGFIFIYGYNVEKGPFYCSNDDLVIYGYNADHQGEIANIPNNAKYISHYALQMHTNIKMIICGENLEKIGICSCREMENLVYFKANSKPALSSGFMIVSIAPLLRVPSGLNCTPPAVSGTCLIHTITFIEICLLIYFKILAEITIR